MRRSRRQWLPQEQPRLLFTGAVERDSPRSPALFLLLGRAQASRSRSCFSSSLLSPSPACSGSGYGRWRRCPEPESRRDGGTDPSPGLMMGPGRVIERSDIDSFSQPDVRLRLFHRPPAPSTLVSVFIQAAPGMKSSSKRINHDPKLHGELTHRASRHKTVLHDSH